MVPYNALVQFGTENTCCNLTPVQFWKGWFEGCWCICIWYFVCSQYRAVYNGWRWGIGEESMISWNKKVPIAVVTVSWVMHIGLWQCVVWRWLDIPLVALILLRSESRPSTSSASYNRFEISSKWRKIEMVCQSDLWQSSWFILMCLTYRTIGFWSDNRLWKHVYLCRWTVLIL